MTHHPGDDLEDGEPGGEVVEPIEWVDSNRATRRAGAKRYVRARRVYVVDFDDPELADFEVRARSVSIGRYLRLLKLAAKLDRGQLTEMTVEDVDAIEALFAGFAEALVSWNLDDPDPDGGPPTPVAPTFEGVMSQDTDFMMQIIEGWMTAIGGVADPLDKTSTSGVSSLEASIPMVDPSPSPSS